MRRGVKEEQLTNLLEETLDELKKHDLSEEDVDWVGSEDGMFAIGWEDFKQIAKDVNYDGGFGSQKIATDLVIVMRNGGYFSRGEYDGSEWWDFNTTPSLTFKPKEFKVVYKEGEMWQSLGKMNIEDSDVIK